MRSPTDMLKTNRSSRKKTYFQKPDRGKKILRWSIGILLLIILIIFLTGNRSLLKLYSLHIEKNELQKQKESVIQQRNQLEEEIKKLETDEHYLEEVARDKFNLKKEGEEDNKAVAK
jgi:cell division protein FtsB